MIFVPLFPLPMQKSTARGVSRKTWVILPMQVKSGIAILLSYGGVKPEGVGTSRIFRDRAPLELTGAVIVLVTSLMIYYGITVWIRNKHFRYKQMNFHIVSVQAYTKITALIVKRL